MKLFQQLLVAPAALGLLAPVAASAADLNLEGVSDYSASKEQVSGISQFSDLYPTDWAYQAITSLAKRHGCVAGLRGNQSISRYEAASILNQCLDRVTEVTDEISRLVSEFDIELATIRGSVDGIEARVGEMEAGQFSTTTKLSGTATFVVGGNSYTGDGRTTPTLDTRAKEAGVSDGATVFNYDYKLDLDTSFTGEDLFKTRLRTGNFASSPFSGSGYVGLAMLEVANSGTDDEITVDRMFYQFPYGDDITVTVGPKVRQDDMLAVWPSAYPADSILEFFTYGGAVGAYNLAKGAGAGITYNIGNFDMSANYVSTNGNNGASSGGSGGGLMTEDAGNNVSTQIAYSADEWGMAFAYTYASGDDNADSLTLGNSTPLANTLAAIGVQNSYGLSGWWTPDNIFGAEGGFIPSVSWGWGYNRHEDEDDSNATYESATTQSWYVGLEWDDAFVEGNTFGMAIGQPTFVTDIDHDAAEAWDSTDEVSDGNYAMEWWYAVQVSDNITVTPAIFYLTRPFGHETDTSNTAGDSENTFSNLGALVKTTFKF